MSNEWKEIEWAVARENSSYVCVQASSHFFSVLLKLSKTRKSRVGILLNFVSEDLFF